MFRIWFSFASFFPRDFIIHAGGLSLDRDLCGILPRIRRSRRTLHIGCVISSDIPDIRLTNRLTCCSGESLPPGQGRRRAFARLTVFGQRGRNDGQRDLVVSQRAVSNRADTCCRDAVTTARKTCEQVSIEKSSLQGPLASLCSDFSMLPGFFVSRGTLRMLWSLSPCPRSPSPKVPGQQSLHGGPVHPSQLYETPHRCSRRGWKEWREQPVV